MLLFILFGIIMLFSNISTAVSLNKLLERPISNIKPDLHKGQHVLCNLSISYGENSQTTNFTFRMIPLEFEETTTLFLGAFGSHKNSHNFFFRQNRDNGYIIPLIGVSTKDPMDVIEMVKGIIHLLNTTSYGKRSTSDSGLGTEIEFEEDSQLSSKTNMFQYHTMNAIIKDSSSEKIGYDFKIPKISLSSTSKYLGEWNLGKEEVTEAIAMSRRYNYISSTSSIDDVKDENPGTLVSLNAKPFLRDLNVSEVEVYRIAYWPKTPFSFLSNELQFYSTINKTQTIIILTSGYIWNSKSYELENINFLIPRNAAFHVPIIPMSPHKISFDKHFDYKYLQIHAKMTSLVNFSLTASYIFGQDQPFETLITPSINASFDFQLDVKIFSLDTLLKATTTPIKGKLDAVTSYSVKGNFICFKVDYLLVALTLTTQFFSHAKVWEENVSWKFNKTLTSLQIQGETKNIAIYGTCPQLQDIKVIKYKKN